MEDAICIDDTPCDTKTSNTDTPTKLGPEADEEVDQAASLLTPPSAREVSEVDADDVVKPRRPYIPYSQRELFDKRNIARKPPARAGASKRSTGGTPDFGTPGQHFTSPRQGQMSSPPLSAGGNSARRSTPRAANGTPRDGFTDVMPRTAASGRDAVRQAREHPHAHPVSSQSPISSHYAHQDVLLHKPQITPTSGPKPTSLRSPNPSPAAPPTGGSSTTAHPPNDDAHSTPVQRASRCRTTGTASRPTKSHTPPQPHPKPSPPLARSSSLNSQPQTHPRPQRTSGPGLNFHPPWNSTNKPAPTAGRPLKSSSSGSVTEHSSTLPSVALTASTYSSGPQALAGRPSANGSVRVSASGPSSARHGGTNSGGDAQAQGPHPAGGVAGVAHTGVSERSSLSDSKTDLLAAPAVGGGVLPRGEELSAQGVRPVTAAVDVLERSPGMPVDASSIALPGMESRAEEVGAACASVEGIKRGPPPRGMPMAPAPSHASPREEAGGEEVQSPATVAERGAPTPACGCTVM